MVFLKNHIEIQTRIWFFVKKKIKITIWKKWRGQLYHSMTCLLRSIAARAWGVQGKREGMATALRAKDRMFNGGCREEIQQEFAIP